MTRKRSLFSQIYLPYLLLILLSVLFVSWYGVHTFRELSLDQLASRLESQAKLIHLSLPYDVSTSNLDSVEAVCELTGKTAGLRVTVVLHNGDVTGDSEADPAMMNNHRNRPEIQAALSGQVGSSSRYSRTLSAQMHYVAVPLVREGKTIAVVRTAIAATEIDRAMCGMYVRVGGAGFLIAILAAFSSLYIARRHRHALQELRHGAEKFADGELNTRLKESNVEDLAVLGRAMNKMAAQLDERIRTITEQREEQEAVLSGMVEGVVAVDREKKIIIANEAAARMLGFNAEKAKGCYFKEIVRNSDVQKFVKQALHEDDEQINSFISLDEGNRILQACASVIQDLQIGPRGTVIVFNDITRMRKLEMTRREFVANVSHELKTPITSIKGFVETLRDSTPMSSEESDRFLGIIARQADQLTATIDDLLALGRIEREADSGELHKEESCIYDILTHACLMCKKTADEQGQTINLSAPEELTATVNSRLIEQAAMNLIDNAIKYGKEGGRIEVRAIMDNEFIVIQVSDDGVGIEEEHIPRLFERFYRVDRSRSRAYGGTGLGLAIVKHIALAHRGSVDIDSKAGQGSTFTIRIPLRG